MDQIKLFTPREIAALLRISKAIVSRLIDKGDISAYSIGGQLRIPGVELNRYLKESSTDERAREYVDQLAFGGAAEEELENEDAR